MENLNDIIEQLVLDNQIIKIVMSNVKSGVEKTYQKTEIKPIELKGELFYHATFYYDKKVLHENITSNDLLEKLNELMGNYFKQAMIYSVENDHQILFSKKGKIKHIKNPPTMKPQNLSHNRRKNYIIEEGAPCDFLEELGVMDSNGNVYKKKYDKYRQLNKYLEFVSDAINELDNKRVIKIIDFGCGKAYLTFALYYYLVKCMNFNVEIVGLDLKEDVIKFCNEVASKLRYDGLRFELGDIKDYDYNESVDMVVSLHACDIATDEALAKACKWNARVIFAVPCCQHELFNQIDNKALEPILRFGVIKDKFASLVTDTLRMCALEVMSYDVQLLEFIDMEHTPKNILIRAYKRDKLEETIKKAAKAYCDYRDLFSVRPHIERSLGESFSEKLL